MASSTPTPASAPGSRPQKSKTRRLHIYGRYVLVSLLCLLLTAACIFMLVKTTVVDREAWMCKADSTFQKVDTIMPLRGEIYAADGSVLATNLNYYNIGIDFRASRINELDYIASLDSLSDTLAVYYPQRTRQQWHDYLYAPLNQPKSKRSRSYFILKEIPHEEMLRVQQFPYFRRSKNRNRTGLVTSRVMRRRYPYGEMATYSIGRVNEYLGRIHGYSGLERALDTLLYGEEGLKQKTVFTRGEIYWPIKPARDGYSVTTTIDITIQDILEYELGQMLLESKAKWACAMVMEVATGDIKAITNLEPDTINGGLMEAKNRLVEGIEPGSVIKVISMASALEEGYANLNRVYPIGGSYSYAGGGAITDSHSPASLPVSRFIEYSSNIGMTKLVAHHYEGGDLNGFRADLYKLGFFDRFNSGLAYERPPYYPTLDPKAGGRVNLSRMSYGYAIQVPPLYTCAFYNMIANNGRFVRPRLVKEIHGPNGFDSIIPVSYVREQAISADNAATMRRLIHEVVWGEGGTAKALRNNIVEIAGKTGTSRIAREYPRDKDGKKIPGVQFVPGYIPGKYTVTFCGFFPYENPKYTCIVVFSAPTVPSAAKVSGMVLLNTALKLYARGMLDNTTEITDNMPENVVARPTLYGSHDSNRYSELRSGLDISNAAMLRSGRAGIAQNVVPDVRGLGIREALVAIESSGLEVNFTGTGYVTAIDPPPGSRLQPGGKVTVTLSQN